MANMVKANGVWMKTHLYVENGSLHAKTFLSVSGSPQILHVEVPIAKIASLVERYHRSLHGGKISGCIGGDCVGGCVGCDENDVEVGRRHKRRKILRLAKLSVIRKTMRKVKRVMSKIVKPLVTAAAIVYPPVGLPALAAYKSADAALRGIEKGSNAVNSASKLIEHGKKVKNRTVSKLIAKATGKGLFKKHGKSKVLNAIKRLAKKAVAKKLSKTRVSPAVRQRAASMILSSRKQREAIKRTIAKARQGSFVDQKKQAIYRIVAAHHARLRKLGVAYDTSGDTGLGVHVSGVPTIGGCIGCSMRVSR